MKTKILFIERKLGDFTSIENVFRQIAEYLSKDKFEFSFQKLIFGNSLTGVLKNLIFFRKNAADIYHVTGHVHYIALLLPPERTVLTIHDLGFLHTRKGARRFVLKKILLDLPVKKLKYITAVSDATKQEIIYQTNCDAEKIRVIENPLRDGFLVGEQRNFDRENPTILQVGTMENKNIPNLAKALNGIHCKLKIVGRLNSELTGILNDNKIVYENVFDLNDEQMKRAYADCDLVAFCSAYEGFGLPILEAQARKKPVITSDLSPMKEVAGRGAFLADPNNVSSIREGIVKIINDENYRKNLIEAGAKNIERFAPSNISGQYETLYREMIQASK
jgi:glycosyltransferase involved in cell wall biosynthesis